MDQNLQGLQGFKGTAAAEFIDELALEYKKEMIHQSLIEGAFSEPPDNECSQVLQECFSLGSGESTIFPPGLIGSNLEDVPCADLSDEPVLVSVKKAVTSRVQSDKVTKAAMQMRSSKYIDKHGIDEASISQALSKHKHAFSHPVTLDVDNEQYLDMTSKKKKKGKQMQPIPEF